MKILILVLMNYYGTNCNFYLAKLKFPMKKSLKVKFRSFLRDLDINQFAAFVKSMPPDPEGPPKEIFVLRDPIPHTNLPKVGPILQEIKVNLLFESELDDGTSEFMNEELSINGIKSQHSVSDKKISKKRTSPALQF
jgi:hypothetical protein